MNEIKTIREIAEVVYAILNLLESIPDIDEDQIIKQRDKLAKAIQELMGDEKSSLSHSD
jgi:hypothetical protein